MINIQPAEKLDRGDGKRVDVHSVFKTIQGEGPFTGRPAVFVRLAGCNLQCPDCDTEYTGSGVQNVLVDDLVAEVQSVLGTANLVVITGGEPFRQNISVLVYLLRLKNITVQIETNGTLPVPPNMADNVVIVCSPKIGTVQKSVATRAACFKYVMSSGSVDAEDGLPILALGHSAAPKVCRPPKGVPVYLQPMDCGEAEGNKRNLQACVESCLKHGYTLQLQTHKLIGVE